MRVLFLIPYNTDLVLFKVYMQITGVFQFDVTINVLVSFSGSFEYLYVMGLRSLSNSFSAGTVFIRQNLTSTDVRF